MVKPLGGARAVRMMSGEWSYKRKLLLTISLYCLLLTGSGFLQFARADTGWTTTRIVSTYSWQDSWDISLYVDIEATIHIAWADAANVLGPPSDYRSDIYYWKKWRLGLVEWGEVPPPMLPVSTESTIEYDPLQLGSGCPSLCVSPYSVYDWRYRVYIAWDDFSRLPGSADSAESLYNPQRDVFFKTIGKMGTGQTGLGDYYSPTMLVSESNDVNNMEPSIDVDSDRVVHIAWTSGYSIHYRNFERGFEEIGGFSEIESVAMIDAGQPSLGVGPDGKVHIAWRNSDISGPSNEIFYRRYEPGSGWTTTEVVSTEITGHSYDPKLAVDDDGKVHIAWFTYHDNGDSNIFYRRFEPDKGWTTTEEVSTEGKDAERPSLDVGPDGKLHIAWQDETDYDGSGTDLDIFYRRYDPDSEWTTTEVVSTESTDESGDPSLAVGPNGVVHIAWVDVTNLDDCSINPDDRDIFYKSYEPPEASGWWPWVYLFIIFFFIVIVFFIFSRYWKKKYQ